ncbi:peptide-N4-(N-acetyl-beta- glucosaminyl)asparagine amidase [Podila clonocystis]|nr:peptide-N4-(N-acetyl-beta- glucosaminyl)asparagine amidase [Podila clonocystis]
MDKEAQRELAKNLAAQFATIRHQSTSAASSTSASTSANAVKDANIAELASRLGTLMVQTPATPSPVQRQTGAISFESIPDPSIYEQDFVSTYTTVNESVKQMDDRELLDLASDLMPISQLFEEAEAMAAEHPEDSIDDTVIRRLLHWFKNDFFKWVNEPPCTSCQGKTTFIAGAAPTPQERVDGAGMVETYRCSQSCTEVTRFPRYGGVPKILFETRRGRCGEWAHTFTVCCRALGYKARYVHDTTDHVWTEVWSEHKKRWIHCDSCEAAYDQPLLYSTGWGKTLSYCIAFSGKFPHTHLYAHDANAPTPFWRLHTLA